MKESFNSPAGFAETLVKPLSNVAQETTEGDGDVIRLVGLVRYIRDWSTTTEPGFGIGGRRNLWSNLRFLSVVAVDDGVTHREGTELDATEGAELFI